MSEITVYNVSGVIKADPGSQFVWVKYVDAQTVMDVNVAAAEQRVVSETLNRVLDAGNVMAQTFFSEGVKAAREAVEALDRFHFSAARSRGYPALTIMPVASDYPDSYLFPPAVFAAIDALREEKQ